MFQARLRTAEELNKAVWRLFSENIDIMKKRGYPMDPFSNLYVYRREENGQNYFANIEDIERQGWGDCEDWAAWLIAYLRAEGYQARPLFLRQSVRLFHVSVEVFINDKWKQIDPSKLKGM